MPRAAARPAAARAAARARRRRGPRPSRARACCRRGASAGARASASAGTRTRVPVRAAGPLPQARRVAGPPRRPRRRQGGAPGRPSVAAPRRPDGRVAALWPQLPEVDGRPAPSSWAGTGAGDRDGRGPLLYNRAPAPVIRRSARSLSSVPTPLPAHYWEIPITYKLSTGMRLRDLEVYVTLFIYYN